MNNDDELAVLNADALCAVSTWLRAHADLGHIDPGTIQALEVEILRRIEDKVRERDIPE